MDLPLRQLGYTSVIELMDEMSDVVVIARESPHDWKLYDCKHPPAKSPVKSPAGRLYTVPTTIFLLGQPKIKSVSCIVGGQSCASWAADFFPLFFKKNVGKKI